nr:hypothetical protein [Tanacetum cinerariifolium]
MQKGKEGSPGATITRLYTGPKEPHDPDYVPEPIYPKYITLKDEHVFPVEEKPLPPVDSPTAELPGYVVELDLEEDPEEYEDDERTTDLRVLQIGNQSQVDMSLASSTVTYTSVYTDSEPGRVFWGADEELSDGGSSRFIVYGYDGLPMRPPHDPDFVPEPIYPEYIPLEDEHILLAEKQPLPPVVSPTAESPGYVAESDLDEDPEEYEEDEAEDGPVYYPIDGGDDDDDRDSSGYDTDDKDEDEEDEEEEEEHLASADFAIIIPIDELVSSPEGTEPTIPPPSTDTTTIGARITIRPQTSI